jgi:hypothetical protein
MMVIHVYQDNLVDQVDYKFLGNVVYDIHQNLNQNKGVGHLI